MRLVLAGLNHRTAPLELRERVAITPNELPAALASLRGLHGVREAAILSTCNRVELVAVCEENAPELVKWLAQRCQAPEPELREHLYSLRDQEAVRHLFRVAASLDSMVVGEPQILGQVKEAFRAAHAAGAAGRELDRLLQATIGAAKRVRNETGIAGSSVSIASVAVDLALKIFGSLHGKRVLLVGAGKMGELAARHLLARGAGSITVANRTRERAERLAQSFHGRVLAWERLLAEADEADIVISSTGSHEPVFRRDDGARFAQRRRGRPMFFIDIAVPRDVDPEMNRVDGVFVYDIDDLQKVADAHLLDRGREAARAERLIDAEVDEWVRRGQAVDVVPALVALQGSVEAMRQAELRRAAGQLVSFTPEQLEVVESLTRGFANKVLHGPMRALKEAAREGDKDRVELLRGAFGLTAPLPQTTPVAPEAEQAKPERLKIARRA